MTNNCETRKNFVCKLDKYTITPPDENAPSHLGSPVECENGWTSLDGGLDCFRTFGKEVVYAEARRSCLSFDSSVASIHDLVKKIFEFFSLYRSDDEFIRTKPSEYRHRCSFEDSLDRRWKNSKWSVEVDGRVKLCLFKFRRWKRQRRKCSYACGWEMGISGFLIL